MLTHFAISLVLSFVFIILTSIFAWKAFRTTMLSKIEKALVIGTFSIFYTPLVFQPSNIVALLHSKHPQPNVDVFYAFLPIIWILLGSIAFLVSFVAISFYLRTKTCIFKYITAPFHGLTEYDRRAIKFMVISNFCIYLTSIVLMGIAILIFTIPGLGKECPALCIIPFSVLLASSILLGYALSASNILLDNKEIESHIDSQFRYHKNGKIYTGVSMYVFLSVEKIKSIASRAVVDLKKLKQELANISK